MATLEERVAYIEGQMAEQTHAFVAIRELLAGIDRRIDRVEQRIDRLEQRVDARFEALDGKMSRQFLWMVGIQITILIAVLGTVLSRG
jgi:uncharacterized coiled-coil protein SlyX